MQRHAFLIFVRKGAQRNFAGQRARIKAARRNASLRSAGTALFPATRRDSPAAGPATEKKKQQLVKLENGRSTKQTASPVRYYISRQLVMM